jgi:hypothetical protein
MNSSTFSLKVNKVEKQLAEIIEAVSERGYDDIEEEADDYRYLLQKLEFRDCVIYEIYDSYFVPKRHEFDLELIRRIVETIVESKPLLIIGTAAFTGITGNAAYDLVKRLFSFTAQRFKGNKKRVKPFQDIANDLEKIKDYFKNRKQVTANRIASEIDIDSCRIEPLLKLLGFKSRRKKRKLIWIRPDDWRK